MHLTRQSMHELMEMIGEANQSVRDARENVHEETRRKKIELAENALRRLESLMEEAEA